MYKVSEFGILDFPCGAERLPDGTTIIADAGDEQQRGSELLLVDANGQVTWSFCDGLLFPHSAVLLPNGNLLVTDTTNNRIVEVSFTAGIVFSSETWGDNSGRLSDGSLLDYPNDAHQTPDGNYLITDRNNDRCIVVSPDGQVLWEYSAGLKHPHNADYLDTGDVIIADSDHNRVIQVSQSKEVVWSYTGTEDDPLAWPRDADRLANGNTLICDSKNNRVLEVRPDGKIVWQYGVPYFANFYDADRLPNGNTLIVDQQHQRVFEVEPGGTIVWQFRNYRPAVHPLPKLTNGSFKTRSESGNPDAWMLMTRVAEGGGSLAWEQDEQGRPYPVLEFDRGGAVALMQLVTVKGGRKYRIAAELRTSAMDDGSIACLQLAYRDEYGGWFEDVLDSPKGVLMENQADWIEDVIEVVAPDEARSVEVRILLVGPGRVHVRRVMMIQS